MVTMNIGKATNLELVLTGRWEAPSVRELIDHKNQNGERPTYMLLGRSEMSLLKQHLSEAFGEEAVQSTKDLYYMGLSVLEMQNKETMFLLTGRKNVSLADAFGHHRVGESHRHIA